jgi:hypothetical protein
MNFAGQLSFLVKLAQGEDLSHTSPVINTRLQNTKFNQDFSVQKVATTPY